MCLYVGTGRQEDVRVAGEQKWGDRARVCVCVCIRPGRRRGMNERLWKAIDGRRKPIYTYNIRCARVMVYV